jgi:predicted phage replisome organizer
LADEWFKLDMDIFSNRKIKYLRRLPGGNDIALFWVALLSEARRCNSDGKVFLTESIPYTPDMLAEEFCFDETIVDYAIDKFKQLDMIHINNGFITITGWEDHQNAEGLAKIREQNRERQAKYRAKQQQLQEEPKSNVTDNVTVTLYNAPEEDKEREKELDNKKESISCQQIVDLYHSICKSFPTVRSLSDARRKAIKARLNTYTLEDFQTVFENAEASSFLKGSNERNWTATFDWLIKDANMAKVLEGNYADKQQRYTRKEIKPNWMQPSMEMGEAELDAIKRMMGTQTVESNPAIAQEAEAMQQRMREKYGRKEA